MDVLRAGVVIQGWSTCLVCQSFMFIPRHCTIVSGKTESDALQVSSENFQVLIFCYFSVFIFNFYICMCVYGVYVCMYLCVCTSVCMYVLCVCECMYVVPCVFRNPGKSLGHLELEL